MRSPATQRFCSTVCLHIKQRVCISFGHRRCTRLHEVCPTLHELLCGEQGSLQCVHCAGECRASQHIVFESFVAQADGFVGVESPLRFRDGVVQMPLKRRHV